MSPSGLAPASSFNEPAWNARAKARMLAARVLTIPSLAMSPTLALAMRCERREPCELRKRRPDLLAESFGETARDRRRGFYCDLLSKNRADCHFETVKRAGHAQTGILRHAFFQELIFHQMRRDQIRPRREVEQVAQPP